MERRSLRAAVLFCECASGAVAAGGQKGTLIPSPSAEGTEGRVRAAGRKC